MDTSILNSIKKLLGISADVTDFDEDIIIHINSAIFTLTQLGIGPDGGFMITSKEATYIDFVGNNFNYGPIQTYIYYRTKLGFDPPANASVLKAMTDTISEMEWRLRTQMENPEFNWAWDPFNFQEDQIKQLQKK